MVLLTLVKPAYGGGTCLVILALKMDGLKLLSGSSENQT